jgi:hypothetical protein
MAGITLSSDEIKAAPPEVGVGQGVGRQACAGHGARAILSGPSLAADAAVAQW